jgi:hypothetical protein
MTTTSQNWERHPAHWYAKLADHLGHAGYVTMAEIGQAERAGWQPAR